MLKPRSKYCLGCRVSVEFHAELLVDEKPQTPYTRVRKKGDARKAKLMRRRPGISRQPRISPQ